MTKEEKKVNEARNRIRNHRLFVKDASAAERELALATKMNWLAADAATSSIQDPNHLNGKEGQLKLLGLGERFAVSAEEELAYCVQDMESIGLSVFDGPETPDVMVLAIQLDSIIRSAAELRVRIAMKQLSRYANEIPPGTLMENYREPTDLELALEPDLSAVCDEVENYVFEIVRNEIDSLRLRG